MTNLIQFTRNGIHTLANTLPYLPLVFLIIGFLGWALFMVVPTIWRLHNAAYFTFIDNLLWVLVGLVVLIAAYLFFTKRKFFWFSFMIIAGLILATKF